MANQKPKSKELLWSYYGENKQFVVMTMTADMFEVIKKAVQCYCEVLHESDTYNYTYTAKDRML